MADRYRRAYNHRRPHSSLGDRTPAATCAVSRHLIFTHGMLDDYVHVQSAMHLVDALQQAGRTFESMLYAEARAPSRAALRA